MSERRAIAASALAALSACALVLSCSEDSSVDSRSDAGSGGSGAAGGAADGGGAAGTSGAGGTGATTPGGPIIEHELSPSDEDFMNPERGFYDGVELVDGGSFDQVRANGRTLAYAGVRLDEHRNSPLDAELLDALGAGFGEARSAGIKIVLRFVYNAGPYPNPEPDAPLDRVLEHLGQLAPVLADNQDVIAVMQAGLIGAWGEWHSSTNGLDSAQNRQAILQALLAALPPSRMTQIRTPNAKADIFGPTALAEAQAFDGSDQARTGHHNDCFLATDSDYGTYPDPIETWKDYVASDGRYTPIGGETCQLNPPRTDCAAASQELERLHWSFLNALYNTDVIDAWQTQGCLGEIQKRLGYRFSFARVAYSEKVRPGGVVALELTIENSGYASPFNPRPVYVVLEGGGARHVAELPGVDPRRWQSGEEVKLSLALRLPAELSPGSYELGLWLPDASASIADRQEYAIRFANDGIWKNGHNAFAQIEVDPDAPGDADPNATELRVLH